MFYFQVRKNHFLSIGLELTPLRDNKWNRIGSKALPYAVISAPLGVKFDKISEKIEKMHVIKAIEAVSGRVAPIMAYRFFKIAGTKEQI